jgi:hypothetical protein
MWLTLPPPPTINMAVGGDGGEGVDTPPYPGTPRIISDMPQTGERRIQRSRSASLLSKGQPASVTVADGEFLWLDAALTTSIHANGLRRPAGAPLQVSIIINK